MWLSTTITYGNGVNVLTLLNSNSAVSSLLETTASGVTTEIYEALPIAGGVFAVVAGIFIGLKIFKRVTGARS